MYECVVISPQCPKELASAIESGIGGCRTLKKLRATHCDTLLLPCVKGVVSNGNIEELFFTSMLNGTYVLTYVCMRVYALSFGYLIIVMV